MFLNQGQVVNSVSYCDWELNLFILIHIQYLLKEITQNVVISKILLFS